jgi:hypothetical protein
MSSYTLPPQAIPVVDDYDVIVVGGGPAGCAAAAAAARDGVRTLLLEATGALGGMGTAGLVPSWAPFTDHERVIYCGIAARVLAETKAAMPHVPATSYTWVPIDPEALKRVYDNLVTECGATVQFNTMLSLVERDAAGGVTAIVATSKAGLTAYRAKIFIDCTGDADLAAWAGAECHKGDEDDGRLMPASLCFVLANVDDYAYKYGPNLHGSNRESPIFQILASGKYPLIPDQHICQHTIGPGTVGFNAGHLWEVDNTDPASVSQALMEGRKLAAAFRDALAEFVPAAFGNAFLAATGSLLGIRETRRIVGDYVLTAEDYLARRSFADDICRNSYYLDVHGAKKTARLIAAPSAKGETDAHGYGKGESHGIPYRCLTPKGLANVLVAGRAISCERAVMGSVRVMPTCLAMGEAAGVAAAQAARMTAPDVHAVDTDALRTRLRAVGAYLP